MPSQQRLLQQPSPATRTSFACRCFACRCYVYRCFVYRCFVYRCFVYRSRRLLIPKLGVEEGAAKQRNQPANRGKSRQRSGSKPAEGRVSDSAVIKDMPREKTCPEKRHAQRKDMPREKTYPEKRVPPTGLEPVFPP